MSVVDHLLRRNLLTMVLRKNDMTNALFSIAMRGGMVYPSRTVIVVNCRSGPDGGGIKVRRVRSTHHQDRESAAGFFVVNAIHP